MNLTTAFLGTLALIVLPLMNCEATSSALELAPSQLSFENKVIVMTDNGAKAVEKVLSTDKVYCLDEKTHKFSAKKVIKIVGSDATEMIEVGLAGGGKIFCTPNQGFWVEHQGWTQPRNPFPGEQVTQGWKQARCLFPGDQIKTREGQPAKVYNITVHRIKSRVYHLQLEDSSNYCVGSQGLVVSS